MTSTTVSWNPAPVDEQVTSYNVFQSVNGASFTFLVNVTDSEVVLDDLPAGVYQWRVTALNLAGESPQSVAVDGPQIPATPDGLSVEVIVI
jgi:hypothetical protein